MASQAAGEQETRQEVTIEDVNRVLEVGRLLLSVLTPEELAELSAETRLEDGGTTQFWNKMPLPSL